MEFKYVTISIRVSELFAKFIISVSDGKCHFIFRVHICVTNLHTQDGVADQFLADIKSVVAQMMINPEKPVEGKVR